MTPLIAQAVRNNAEWCDAVCRARRVAATFSELLWASESAPPPYYPDIITLEPSTPLVVAMLHGAIAARPDVRSVKDSYADVDLGPLGFSVLFDARWFGRPPEPPAPLTSADGFIWTVVRTEAEFTAWKTAWDAGILATDPIFVPSLMEDENIRFIQAMQGDEVVAGAIVNRHADAVGISNFFSRSKDTEARWAGCVALAMREYSGLQVVGYAQGAELAVVLSTGFRDLGPLRVWVRE